MANKTKAKSGAKSTLIAEPATSEENQLTQTPSGSDIEGSSNPEEIQEFLSKARSAQLQSAQTPIPRTDARLIFAMDATMSRQPTWDLAISLQADMFSVVEEIDGLMVQLVFFRGLRECKSSKWVSEAAILRSYMASVQCRAGRTKINKILKHALRETKQNKVNAVVYIGDAVEENPDQLAHLAGKLKIFGVPLFMFQEGGDLAVRSIFKELATISGGAYHPFNPNAANELAELLKSVAAFTAGGKKGLEALVKLGNKAAPTLLAQLERDKKS